MKKHAPSANENHTAPATLRFFMMRGGSVALSFFHSWIPTKQHSSTKAAMNKPTMRALSHAYTVPPHCSASRQHTMAGMTTAVPRKSSCARRWRADDGAARRPPADEAAAAAACGAMAGVRKSTTAVVSAPKGRLIQKHQRQEARSVRAPPSRGPAMAAMPETAPSAPV